MKASINKSMGFMTFLTFALTGCGDESLGETFKKKDPPVEDLGPKSPIVPGSTVRYTISSTYRPTSGNDPGTAMSLPEQQAYAQLCLKVDEVRDTATSQYKDAAETVILGRAKVDGGSTSPEILLTDDINASVDPAAVDFAQRNLWLRRLTFPQSRNHGYGTPHALTFDLRSTFSPDRTLVDWPFFEVREATGWRGWTDVLSALFTGYMTSVVGIDMTPTSTAFKQKITSLPASTCEPKTDQASCFAAGCGWEFDGNKCVGKFLLSMLWREAYSSGEAPAELVGAVVHRLDVEYTQDGILKLANEIIVPDTDPGAALTLGGTSACTQNPACGSKLCITGEPCAIASIDRDVWTGASCTF